MDFSIVVERIKSLEWHNPFDTYGIVGGTVLIVGCAFLVVGGIIHLIKMR